MKVLVACCNAGGALYSVDLLTKNVEMVLDQETRGICYLDGYYYMAHQLKPKGGIGKYDLNFNEVAFYQDASEWHGIFTDGQMLYVTLPTLDLLYVFDRDMNLHGEIKIGPGEKETRCHINDGVINGAYLYLTMFRDKIGSTSYGHSKDGKAKRVRLDQAKTDPAETETVVGGLEQPHSPYWARDEFYVCNSQHGKVLRNGGVFCDLGDVYTRGLLMVENDLLVGNSVFRDNIDRGRCGVAVVNENGQEQQFISLPSNEVYAIIHQR